MVALFRSNVPLDLIYYCFSEEPNEGASDDFRRTQREEEFTQQRKAIFSAVGITDSAKNIENYGGLISGWITTLRQTVLPFLTRDHLDYCDKKAWGEKLAQWFRLQYEIHQVTSSAKDLPNSHINHAKKNATCFWEGMFSSMMAVLSSVTDIFSLFISMLHLSHQKTNASLSDLQGELTRLTASLKEDAAKIRGEGCCPSSTFSIESKKTV